MSSREKRARDIHKKLIKLKLSCKWNSSGVRRKVHRGGLLPCSELGYCHRRGFKTSLVFDPTELFFCCYPSHALYPLALLKLDLNQFSWLIIFSSPFHLGNLSHHLCVTWFDLIKIIGGNWKTFEFFKSSSFLGIPRKAFKNRVHINWNRNLNWFGQRNSEIGIWVL